MITLQNSDLANCSYPIDDVVQIKRKMLGWANRSNIFCFLDNQQYSMAPHRFEALLGAGALASVQGGNAVDLDAFLAAHTGWKLGHLSYEWNHHLFGIQDNKPNPVGFPSLYFFVPEVLILLKEGMLIIEGPDPDRVYSEIMAQEDGFSTGSLSSPIQATLSRNEYLEKIRTLQAHIQRGDCYEVNFCQEFFALNAAVAPVSLFQHLMEVSPNPFGALYRCNDSYLLCASPERYISKEGNRLISQPIKGTIKRNVSDPQADEALKQELRQSEKDQSENVMVVDLVRNDLSQVAEDGSVQVDELYGIYTYPQVHQMISTVSCRLREGVGLGAVLEASFPMGSMTGAPKKRVMQLIDRYEPQRRGIFSGSLGYITPEGDFDLNVVIRSIMYNAATHYLSYQVGSGITFYSNPESEWEECLLKAEGIKKVLGA